MPEERRSPAAGARQKAETLALGAVEFLAMDLDRLRRFLDLSGTTPVVLRERLGEPAFLVGVLDHLLGDEKLLLEFAGWAGIAPDEIARARRIIGGPATNQPA